MLLLLCIRCGLPGRLKVSTAQQDDCLVCRGHGRRCTPALLYYEAAVAAVADFYVRRRSQAARGAGGAVRLLAEGQR